MSHAPRTETTPSPAARSALRWGLLVLIVLSWTYALFGDEGILTQRRRRQRLDVLKERVAREAAINRALAAEVEGLAHDDFVLERAIRLELDYQRPGETVLVVGSDDPLVPAPAAPGSAVAPPPG
ncbi:MAG: septum formation initiator family protein [Acidobacteriota bacterium]|nr:septum formation initiator family protein [Acidobacteriota bacterium]MDQ7088635.1 septum formation initiator family protein [Acidobacteriota bacterium]